MKNIYIKKNANLTHLKIKAIKTILWILLYSWLITFILRNLGFLNININLLLLPIYIPFILIFSLIIILFIIFLFIFLCRIYKIFFNYL